MINKIIIYIMFFISVNVIAETNYFYSAIKSKSNGIISVYITKRIGMDGCLAQLKHDENTYKAIPGIQILSAKCIKETQLPSDYNNAFNMKKISKSMYIAFKNEIWQTRTIMYNLDKTWLTKQGCNYVVKNYKKIDSDAICIFNAN